MKDFGDIEKELHQLRPLAPSRQLWEGVARQLTDANIESEPTKGCIVTPSRFNFGWISLGLGLAAAAALFVMTHFDLPGSMSRSYLTTASPSAAPLRPLTSSEFIPAGASRVVYDTQDEGLIYPRGASRPVRQVWSRARETLQWHNPVTGASLRVSYPSDEVQLIPVEGQ